MRSWACWLASTAEALKQFRQRFHGPELPATKDMPQLRAALNKLIPAPEDLARLREAPPPPPPLPPPLAPASSARLSPTSPAQPAPRSAQSPAPQYPPSAAYLSWPTCHPSPAWREPASARPTSVVPTPVPPSAPTLVAHSSTPSPNPVGALADALSKPGLLASLFLLKPAMAWTRNE